MGFPAFILSLAAWTIEISHLKISYFIINPPQKCQDAKIIQYLSQSLLWPILSFSAFTLLQTASKIGMSYLISSSFMITHFKKFPECQKCSISIIVAVLANFETLSQQIDVPLGLPMGFSAFTLSQTASRMRICYLIFLYFMIIHFQKCPKMPEMLNFRHNCCFGQLWAPVTANRCPSWDTYGPFSLYLVTDCW